VRFKNVYIEGLAYHLPKNIVSSDDLEKRLAPVYDRLKLPFGRLEMMTGIKERRFWDKGVCPSQVASKAGELAILNSGIDRVEIGCLINASVCRDFLEPATASLVHYNLGLRTNTLVFDISNACLGVLNGMVHVANMIELGQIRAGLVVAGENGGPLVDATIKSLLNKPELTRNEIKSSFASLITSLNLHEMKSSRPLLLLPSHLLLLEFSLFIKACQSINIVCWVVTVKQQANLINCVVVTMSRKQGLLIGHLL